jgi:benzoyl-CoA reductase subunit D
MITAGVDCGSKNVRVVVVRDGEVVAQAMVPAGMDTEKVVATGAGKNEPEFRNDVVTDVGADARGAIHLFPEARTVIDVGAEEGRAIKIDAQGKVVDFAINEKCAAGAGAFTESMARALEVKLEDLGPLSLKSTQAIPMNAQCAVFAESEVVTLVHKKTSKEDMARAIHDAIADRITSMVRRVGIEEKIALVGGVAYNVGFVKSLEEDLNTKVLIPERPQFVGALGAALVAAGK